ncbi:DUF6090 family protein [Maribacter cobaltidurans]|uniref:Uncharacterized protein n=1 Tax=Maribacter cobaltidurans TaxID=1178778 RepID=A0A223V8S4_9FLAO|nr:DUF6090 family protein [Maribacter cobaltidurans]ASV31803.1 hypothetical protein CJ263_17150 [Maribacter cobaltidurans]GGD84726.1 hypothetical protein GCM10011412_23080 [Maribacter cobaltidurans]
MIKFFRRIRQQLLSENKFSKYLLYAIGEIILVVIGILIALQINNWNEDRINSKKETIVLANIHKEFTQNKKQLDSVVGQHQVVFKNCTGVIGLFPIKSKPGPEALDSLATMLWWTYGGNTFNPTQTSINALASTSSFDIIKNETLRDLLISWNDLVTDYQEEELASRDHIWSQYDPYLSKHFDWNLNFKDERNDFDALQTLEFEYLVRSRYDLVDQILNTSGELQKVQATLDKIIELSKPSGNQNP